MRRLPADEVDKWWDKIRTPIFSCLPPAKCMHPKAESVVKRALLKGMLQVWLLVEDNRIVMLTMTGFYLDPYIGTRVLVIYAVYRARIHKDEILDEWLKELKDFAKDNGCHDLVMIKPV